MSKPEKPSKPRKAPAKKAAPRKRPARPANPKAPARKRPAKAPEGTVPKSEWLPAKDNPTPVGRALHFAVAAFKGDKGALSEYLGIHRPNLSRALTHARLAEEGKVDTVAWPLIHVLRLSKISGVAPHELAPDAYEPHMKPKRVKVVDGTVKPA